MPFHIQAKNSKTGEIITRDVGDAVQHSLTIAVRRGKNLATQLNEEQNSTDWEGVAQPEYFHDPRERQA